MNIFILSLVLSRCMRSLFDCHVVKMPLETAQLLYFAHWIVDPTGHALKLAPFRKNGAGRGYASSKGHLKHPCSVWAAATVANYRWLADYGVELCAEYTHRYGKIHSCQEHIEWLKVNEPPFSPEALGCRRTPFAQAVPEWIKELNVDAVTAYRLVYIHEKDGKIKMTTYKNRERPKWLQDPKLLAYASLRPAESSAAKKAPRATSKKPKGAGTGSAGTPGGSAPPRRKRTVKAEEAHRYPSRKKMKIAATDAPLPGVAIPSAANNK